MSLFLLACRMKNYHRTVVVVVLPLLLLLPVSSHVDLWVEKKTVIACVRMRVSEPGAEVIDGYVSMSRLAAFITLTSVHVL